MGVHDLEEKVTGRIRTVDTRDMAKEIRQTFYGKDTDKERRHKFGWPARFVECGKVIAVMYSSDKWYFDEANRDYMHIAEAPQKFLAVPGFVREQHGKALRPLELCGSDAELLEPMPEHIANLAPCIGLRIDFYTDYTAAGKPRVRGDQGVREVDTPGAMLGGARHPVNNVPFLLVYTPNGGVHCIITGKKLDIDTDGIVG
jgi:hypothetical protein